MMNYIPAIVLTPMGLIALCRGLCLLRDAITGNSMRGFRLGDALEGWVFACVGVGISWFVVVVTTNRY